MNDEEFHNYMLSRRMEDLEAWHRKWESDYGLRLRREAAEKHFDAGCRGCEDCCD